MIVRREIEGSMQDYHHHYKQNCLVKHGQTIEPKTPVAKTQVLGNKQWGTASIKANNTAEARRLLSEFAKATKQNSQSKENQAVKVGDFVRLDTVLAESGEQIKRFR